MVGGFISGEAHAAEPDQPGDLGHHNKQQDQQPVFGPPGSSGEIGIVAEWPFDKLADGHYSGSRFGESGQFVPGVVNLPFACVRECVSGRCLLDRKAAAMSPSRPFKVGSTIAE